MSNSKALSTEQIERINAALEGPLKGYITAGGLVSDIEGLAPRDRKPLSVADDRPLLKDLGVAGGFGSPRPWMDHPESIGKCHHAFHPYFLTVEDLKELEELRAKGWTVSVSGDSSYSFSTLKIEVSHPEKAKYSTSLDQLKPYHRELEKLMDNTAYALAAGSGWPCPERQFQLDLAFDLEGEITGDSPKDWANPQKRSLLLAEKLMDEIKARAEEIRAEIEEEDEDDD